jgi:hypothetical protein
MSENLKPLSIKQLIDKLNLIMKEFDVSENDLYSFIHLLVKMKVMLINSVF